MLTKNPLLTYSLRLNSRYGLNSCIYRKDAGTFCRHVFFYITKTALCSYRQEDNKVFSHSVYLYSSSTQNEKLNLCLFRYTYVPCTRDTFHTVSKVDSMESIEKRF